MQISGNKFSVFSRKKVKCQHLRGGRLSYLFWLLVRNVRIFELNSPVSCSLLRLSRLRSLSLSELRLWSLSALFRSELFDRRFFSGSKCLASGSLKSNLIGVRLRFNADGDLLLLISTARRSSSSFSVSADLLPIRFEMGALLRSSALSDGLLRLESFVSSFCGAGLVALIGLAGFFVGKPRESNVTTNCVLGPSSSFDLETNNERLVRLKLDEKTFELVTHCCE